MALVFSPTKAAIANAAYATGLLAVITILHVIANLPLDNNLSLYALFVLGPVLSALVCKQFAAVLSGAGGLAGGIILFVLVIAVFWPSIHIDAGQVVTLTSILSITAFVISIPVWLWIGPRREPVRTIADQPADEERDALPEESGAANRRV